MRLNYRKIESGKGRFGKSRELLRHKEPDESNFNPYGFIQGKDRTYLEDLLRNPNPDYLEYEILAESAWIGALDKTHLEKLAQVPYLEDHIWGSILLTRNSSLRPLGKELSINQITLESAFVVLRSYLQGVDLLDIFPNSAAKQELADLFQKEKLFFMRLLDDEYTSIRSKIEIIYTLARIEPATLPLLKKKLSVDEIGTYLEAVEFGETTAYLPYVLILYPELHEEVLKAFEGTKRWTSEVFEEKQKRRFESLGDFKDYLAEAFDFTIFSAQHVSLTEDTGLKIQVAQKLEVEQPPLPDRPEE